MFMQALQRVCAYRMWLALALSVCLLGVSSGAAYAVSVQVRAVDGISDQDVEDLLEEDEEASENRVSGCDLKPLCEFPDGDRVYIEPGQESVTIPFKADALCDSTLTFTLFLFIDDQLEFFFPFFDDDEPRCFELTIYELEDLQAGESIEVKVKVVDNRFLTYSTCSVTIEVMCDSPPVCYYDGERFTPGSRIPVFDVTTGDILPVYEVCAESACGGRARIEMYARPPFLEPIGHRKGGVGEKVCIETRADDVVEGGYAEGTYWAKFKCTDLDTGRVSEFAVGYRYTDPEPEPESCDDLPVCEVLEGSSITVDAGMTGLLTVCGSTTCDECDVSIAMTDGPAFVTLYESDVPGADDGVCDSYMVSPGADDAGSHMVTFTVTDCNGATSECAVEVIVPEPDPLRACTENEEALPNDTFADASVIDSGECVDAFGVNIYGVLETPVFVNGDVDYYRIVGLTPDETYIATIVAGMNSEHGFTDTMLGWLVADGVLMTKDDNSGPLAGYSMITFTADSEGVATLAITGHGDDDFNGMMDPSMAFEEYGSGGYMLSIRAAQGDTMPVEQQADLNADGVVDTGDLGILLGLFGATSN